MVQWGAGTSDSASRAQAVLEFYVIQEDAANNRTLIRHAGGIFDNNGSYGGYGTGSWTLWLNGGAESSSSVSYDFSGGGPGWVAIHDHWIYHNAAGEASVTGRMEFSGVSPVGYADTGTQTFTLPNYVRTPGQPSAPALTRTSNGATIGITSAVPSSAVTITAYEYSYSTDNATWTGVSMGNSTTANFSVPSATSPYYIRTRAYSGEGWGDWSPSTFIAGVPSQPTSINVTRVARDVTVTAGASTGNGGATITGYFAQYSENNGSTWSAATAMTGQSVTFTNLTAGVTYLFRVYAQNSTGQSSTLSSSGFFVPAGGRRWDGSQWSSTATAKRWDGSAWVDLTIAKRWNGTSWQDLS